MQIQERLTEILYSLTFIRHHHRSWHPSSRSSFIILVLMNLGVQIIIVVNIIMLSHLSVSCQPLRLCRKSLLKRLHSQNWNFMDFLLTPTSMEAQVMSSKPHIHSTLVKGKEFQLIWSCYKCPRLDILAKNIRLTWLSRDKTECQTIEWHS